MSTAQRKLQRFKSENFLSKHLKICLWFISRFNQLQCHLGISNSLIMYENVRQLTNKQINWHATNKQNKTNKCTCHAEVNSVNPSIVITPPHVILLHHLTKNHKISSRKCSVRTSMNSNKFIQNRIKKHWDVCLLPLTCDY